MKKWIATIVICSVLGYAGYGDLSLADLEKPGTALSFMVLKTKSNDTAYNLGLAPEVHLGDFGLGVNLNLVLPDSKRADSGLDWLVFRYSEYDNQTFGLRYGVLDNINYGYGLICDRYTTLKTASTGSFSSDQGGIKAYSKNFSPFGIYALSTASNVYGGRLTYDFAKVPIIEKPLILGGTYLRDDQRNTYGYAGDIGVSIIDDIMSVYMEYGGLSNKSTGLATGINAKLFSLAEGRLELRNFQENFVPAYFNSTHEVSPINLNLTSPAASGWFGGLTFDLLSFAKASIGYTAYASQQPYLKGAFVFKEINNTSGLIQYEKVFPTNDEVWTGKFYYKVNSWQTLITNYRKVGNQPETYTFEYQFGLPSLF